MVGVDGWGMQQQHQGWRKGPWTSEEDKLLTEYVSLKGEGRWSTVAKLAGLNRNSKSCRLRWVNYLRPGLKRGQLTPQEESIIIELHALWGNKWSMIAKYLPGRTDNEIKNYWRTHFKDKPKMSRAEERSRNRILRRQQGIRDQPQGDYPISPVQIGQEMELMFQQCFSPEILHNGVSSSDDCIEEDGLWGSLWNMDGLQIHEYNQMYDANKLTGPNQ